VIGIPDERWGERPLACVCAAPGRQGDPGRARGVPALSRGGPLAGAVSWTFVAEIPKTAVGKFDKKVLRTKDAAGDLPIERI